MNRILVNLSISILLTFTGMPVFTQVPLNWTRDEINPGEDFTLTPDESFFSEGLKSCHLQLNSSAVPYLVSDVYYITPGAAYTFSFDVFDNDTAGQVKVYADFYDTYGFEIFGQPPVFSSDSSEWQTITWEGEVPGQAVVGFVLVKFYCQPDLYNFTKAASIRMDNFQFRQEGGDNLVANGGFEEWAVGINDPVDSEKSISIYPNPAVDFVTIELPGNSIAVFISDITGREILKLNPDGSERLQIDVRHLPGGLYIIRAILENSSVVSSLLFIK